MVVPPSGIQHRRVNRYSGSEYHRWYLITVILILWLFQNMGRHQQAVFSALKNLAMPGELEMFCTQKI